MGFDDFFEHDKHHKHRHEYNHGHDNYRYSSHSHNDIKYQILNKLKNNPKLRALLIIVSAFILIIIITLIALFMPLIMKFLNFVSQNGIQGLIDVIWKGSK